MLVKVTVWQLLRFDARIYSAAVVVVAAVAGVCGLRCVKGGAGSGMHVGTSGGVGDCVGELVGEEVGASACMFCPNLEAGYVQVGS